MRQLTWQRRLRVRNGRPKEERQRVLHTQTKKLASRQVGQAATRLSKASACWIVSLPYHQGTKCSSCGAQGQGGRVTRNWSFEAVRDPPMCEAGIAHPLLLSSLSSSLSLLCPTCRRGAGQCICPPDAAAEESVQDPQLLPAHEA